MSARVGNCLCVLQVFTVLNMPGTKLSCKTIGVLEICTSPQLTCRGTCLLKGSRLSLPVGRCAKSSAFLCEKSLYNNNNNGYF